MVSQTLHPENFEERVVWFAITRTYLFYLFGALYVVAPVVAWILFAVLVNRVFSEDASVRPFIPVAVKVWILAMLVMLLSLIAGHVSYDLGVPKLIKSTIGWAKGWALLALFPLIGCLNIRPELIYRAAMVVCWHTILLLPVFVLAWAAGLPQTVYVSPLKAIGGPGPEFFSLNLYEIDPGSGIPRWRLFTPWAPAVGFVANVYFVFALRERDLRWKTLGILGCIVMVLMSQSRLALVALVSVGMITFFLSRISRPWVLFLASAFSTMAGIAGLAILNFMTSFWAAFRGARADSTRVREALGRIAVERWRNEAPIWGHGIVERGPHLVEYMPIGSHHSWYGLLFVKGIFGFFALAVPMAFGFLDLLVKAQTAPVARGGLAIMLILFLYTFGENLEILAYLFWPALVLLGCAHSKKPEYADEPKAEP